MIDSIHPLLYEYEDYLDICEIALKGEIALKKKGVIENIVPYTKAASVDEYQQFITRALYDNYPKRVANVSISIIHRKPLVRSDECKQIETILNSISSDGGTIEDLSHTVTQELISSGRVILLLDRSKGGSHPYVSVFKGRLCTNWETKIIDGKEVLTLVVLKAGYYSNDTEDKYEKIRKYRYIEYKLIEDTGVLSAPTKVEINTYEKNDINDWAIVSTTYPKDRNGHLDFIPCVIINSGCDEFNVAEPPLMDIIHTSLSIFRSSAYLEEVLFWGGVTSAFISTEEEIKGKFLLGHNTLKVLPKGSTVGEIKFSSEVAPHVMKNIEDKRKKLALLSSKVIGTLSSAAVSPEVVRLNQSGEDSILANLSGKTSLGLTKIIRMAALWEGKKDNDDIFVNLNSDFLNIKITPKEILAYISAWKQGAMSQKVMLGLFKQGELYPKGLSLEEEQTLIEVGALEKLESDMKLLEDE